MVPLLPILDLRSIRGIGEIIPFSGRISPPKNHKKLVGSWPGNDDFHQTRHLSCSIQMDEIYDPKMNQREFMLKALQSEDKLKPRDVLAFWKQRKVVESVDKRFVTPPPCKGVVSQSGTP
eukprot:COSAG01_NODE_3077_length_6628_cov_82.115638_5_plen_120_part_00